MEVQHLELTLPLAAPHTLDLKEVIPVFHRWIRDQSRPELLIDVADYRHIPGGPGVVLVGHEADYGLAIAGARPGLRYHRKSPVAGDNAARLGQALAALLDAARQLESEPELAGAARFRNDEITVTINDRLLAPNEPETFQALRPEVVRFFAELPCAEPEIEYRRGDPRGRFSFTVKTARPLPVVAVPAVPA